MLYAAPLLEAEGVGAAAGVGASYAVRLPRGSLGVALETDELKLVYGSLLAYAGVRDKGSYAGVRAEENGSLVEPPYEVRDPGSQAGVRFGLISTAVAGDKSYR